MGRIVPTAFATLLTGALLAALGTAGCDSTDGERTKIVVPSAATSAPEYQGDGEIPEQRYVIRMSDGERDWEVEFPSVATGYEMHIPLEARGRNRAGDIDWQGQNLTEADRELLRQLRRQNPRMEREGVYRGGQNVLDNRRGRQGDDQRPRPGAKQNKQGERSDGKSSAQSESDGDQPARREEGSSSRPGLSKQSESDRGSPRQNRKKRSESAPAPSRPSYLLGLQKVRKLYRNGNYEVALVRLVKLEEAYPNDEQLLSMKGTLWLKLGRPKLARKAWERVLQVNPDNSKVRKALQRLNEQNNASE